MGLIILCLGAIILLDSAVSIDPLTRIPIKSRFPPTLDVSYLSSYVKTLLETGQTTGIPGTTVRTNQRRQELQTSLDCQTGNGEWIWDANGGRDGSGLTAHKQSPIFATCDTKFYKATATDSDSEFEWDVRESLKYRWVPSASCSTQQDKQQPINVLSRTKFCQLIAHKSILIAGDLAQFSLHDLVLAHTSLAPQTCYGDLYCKEHSICGDILRHKFQEADIESYKYDQSLYRKLPNPPVPNSFTPHFRSTIEKNPSVGTVLRYARTDGLRAAQAFTGPEYIHPATGIREINHKWMADAYRSDIIILNKPPIPLPLPGWNATWDSLYRWDSEATGVEVVQKIVKAVIEITQTTWIPELLDTLTNLRSRTTKKNLLVYRGTWRMHGDCGYEAGIHFPETSSGNVDWFSPGDGPPPHLSSPRLEKLLYHPNSTRLYEPHVVYHNLQTVIQNQLVRSVVLPHFGAMYLDLENMMSIWRSGMVGGSASQAYTPDYYSEQQLIMEGASKGLRSPASGDCLRYCFPSPGMGIETALFGGLMTILEG